jgi:hypothetical protein
MRRAGARVSPWPRGRRSRQQHEHDTDCQWASLEAGEPAGYCRTETLAQRINRPTQSAHSHRPPESRLTGPPGFPPLRPSPRRPAVPLRLVNGGGDCYRRGGDDGRCEPDCDPQRRRWFSPARASLCRRTVAPNEFCVPAYTKPLRLLHGFCGHCCRSVSGKRVAGCDGGGGREEDECDCRYNRRCSKWNVGSAGRCHCSEIMCRNNNSVLPMFSVFRRITPFLRPRQDALSDENCTF